MISMKLHKKQKKAWFRPKSYGVGLTPCSWEGWGMTLLLVLLIIGLAFVFEFFQPTGPSIENTVYFVLGVFGLTFAFLWSLRKRVRGQLGWKWGKKLMKH